MKVYKYRYGTQRDLNSLKDDYFYAPHPSRLNDPFENLFLEDQIHHQIELLEKTYAQDVANLKDCVNNLCNKIREKVGIYSLSKTAMHELLWAYYADSHAGFCIEYDLEKLMEWTSSSISLDVMYQDVAPKLDLKKLLNNDNKSFQKLLQYTSGTKSTSWAHEQEIRIVTDNYGRVQYDFRAVKAIYFGLRMPKTIQDLSSQNEELPETAAKVCQEQVMEELQGRGIKYYQIELEPNSYRFNCIEIEDLYKDGTKYKDTLKFIDKSCIDYNGYAWDVSSDYFDKVAEIIRRDPYFDYLNSIAISTYQSEIRNEPIIFASFYKNKEDIIPIKRYFNLDEIDNVYRRLGLNEKSPLS
ncbi:DUF2971 domain-containing protein [Acinetobacter sp. CAAS 2-6]|uniref:DUF2971 domain-containing protein n=1 Tax=Acinetobacter sp. CAAS 2-6 TaxID=3016358 RepID=UPI002DD66011|nr:DUF2971 domain-containing protein [Acinetobacter sp. CAAS 2-6]